MLPHNTFDIRTFRGHLVAEINFRGRHFALMAETLDRSVEFWREFIHDYDEAAERLDLSERNDL